MREHSPNAKAPDNQQAGVGQQNHKWAEERPGAIDAVVGMQHSIVDRPKSIDFTLLLSKRLDDANAGNRVGQHAGHCGPRSAAQPELATESTPHVVHQPDDDWDRR